MSRILAVAMVSLGACGGGGDELVPDAPGAPTVVTVVVRDRIDRPVVGATAFGHDASGALVDQRVTDADGEVGLAVPAGGAITVRNAADVYNEYWRTIVAVAPGDRLQVRIPAGGDYDPGWTAPQTVAVTLPALPVGATRIALASPCSVGSADATTTVQLGTACAGPTTLVATASAATGAVVAYLVVPDVDLRPLTTLVAPGAWAAPSATWTLEVANVPAGVRYVSAQRALGDRFPAHVDRGSLANLTVGGAGSVTAPRPDLAGAATYHVVVGPWNGGYRFIVDTSRSPVDRLAVDFAALLPSPVLEVVDDGHRLQWTAVPGADMFDVNLSVAEGSGDVVGRVSSWSVIAPPTTTAIGFPTDVGFPFPPASDPPTRVYGAGVRARETSWWTSYDQLRQDVTADRPAGDFAASSSYDGFSLYNPET